MSERAGRKALFVGVAPSAGAEGDQWAERIRKDLAIITSWVEKALSGDIPETTEEAITEPLLEPLITPLKKLISRTGEDQSALKEQKHLFMTQPLPMAVRDNHLSLIKANQAYESLFSGAPDWTASPGPSSGRSVQVGEESVNSVFMTGKPAVSEITVEQSDGTKKIFQQHAVPCRFSGEKVVLALFFYLDITSLRALQEEVQKEHMVNAKPIPLSSGWYQKNPCPILILDSLFQILDANQAFIAETRLSMENLYGKRIDDLPFLPEKENYHGSIIRTGNKSPLRVYLNRPDGQSGYDLYAFPIEDQDNDARYIVQLSNVSAYLDSIRDLSQTLEKVTKVQSGAGSDVGQEERNETEPEIPEPDTAGMATTEMGDQSQLSELIEGPGESWSAPLPHEAGIPEKGSASAGGLPENYSGQTIRAEQNTAEQEQEAPHQQQIQPSSNQAMRESEGGQAMNRERQPEGGDGQSYGIVEFGLGGSHYALDITITREIVEMMPITPIPHSPAYLKGVMNLRGEIFNIIDIQKILGIGEKRSDPSGKIIVLTSHAADGENIGIIVDNVQSVRQVHDDAIEYIDDSKDVQKARLMKGIIKVSTESNGEKRGEKHLIIWLDMQALVMDLVRQNTQKKANI
jgi:purine-binding chemotaxis protein CheW